MFKIQNLGTVAYTQDQIWGLIQLFGEENFTMEQPQETEVNSFAALAKLTEGQASTVFIDSISLGMELESQDSFLSPLGELQAAGLKEAVIIFWIGDTFATGHGYHATTGAALLRLLDGEWTFRFVPIIPTVYLDMSNGASYQYGTVSTKT